MILAVALVVVIAVTLSGILYVSHRVNALFDDEAMAKMRQLFEKRYGSEAK